MKMQEIISNFSMKKQLSWESYVETKQETFSLKAVCKNFDTSSISNF